MSAGECRSCDHGRGTHADRVGNCFCGCTGYFPQGASRCDNPTCENCALTSALREGSEAAVVVGQGPDADPNPVGGKL